MVACASPESPEIATVAAWAPKDDVTFPTGYPLVNPHVANGVSWYWNNTAGFGYAPEGRYIELGFCDFVNDDGEYRMCVHLTDAWVTFGYRCGYVKNEAAWPWYRVILHTDETENDF